MRLRILPFARKHGISDADIEHAVRHAMSIDDLDDDTRLYLGPGCNAAPLEVVTIVEADLGQAAIHAMAMRPKYRRLLLGNENG